MWDIAYYVSIPGDAKIVLLQYDMLLWSTFQRNQF